jgi:hypothetical protein
MGKLSNGYNSVRTQRGYTKIRVNRGTLTEFKGGQKFSLPSSDNLNYNPYYIGRFIKQGDSVVKYVYSDTIFINGNNTRFL